MELEWREIEPYSNCRVFQKTLTKITHLQALVSIDDGQWHLSLSHRQHNNHGKTKPGRLPTYEELKEARYRFIPDDITMAQLFPPSSQFVNLHETTLHLWQIPKEMEEL